jgi:hypothetical protein
MKKNLIRVLSVSFVSALIAGSALAASDGSMGTSDSAMNDSMRTGDLRAATLPEFGIYGGGATQNGSLYRNDPSFMADVGFSPWGPFAFALQAQYEPSSLNVPFAHINFNTWNFLLKETVALGARGTPLSHVYFGTKTGVAMYTGDVNTTTHLALGGTIGFDIPLSSANRVSLGAEGTYLAVLGGDNNEATPDQTSVLGAVKYWF